MEPGETSLCNLVWKRLVANVSTHTKFVVWKDTIFRRYVLPGQKPRRLRKKKKRFSSNLHILAEQKDGIYAYNTNHMQKSLVHSLDL